MYLLDIRTAIAVCGAELFGILGIVFGKNNRALNFFKDMNYVSPTGTDSPMKEKYCSPSLGSNLGLMKSLIAEFGALDGFKALTDFMNFDTKDKE